MNPAAACNPFMVCNLCNKSLEKPNDGNLVEGKGIFKAVTEINDLPFVVLSSSFIVLSSSKQLFVLDKVRLC